MPYHRSNLQTTTFYCGSSDEIDQVYNLKHQRFVVPSLDLTSLTMDDGGNDMSAKESNRNTNSNKENATTAGVVLFRKQKMPFVFPSETSISDIDVKRGNELAVSSYRSNSMANEPIGEKEPEINLDDNTLSFSLSNHRCDRYNVQGGDISKQDKKVSDYNIERSRTVKSTAFYSGNKPATVHHNQDAKDNTVGNSGQQDVYDVIVVNGHSRHEDIVKEDTGDERIHLELDAGDDRLKDKPKARVTFSFTDTGAPSGRYTPMKGDTRIQLHGVLKKRRTPSPVLRRSCSEDRRKSRQRTDTPILNKESVRLFGSSYTLDQRFGCYTTGAEYGIPVKHVHTTSADLEKKHVRSSVTNNVADKPPVPNRITLAVAEKAAMNGSVRGMPGRDNRLSASHTRGRMAYFRPAERGRSATTQNGRSRSSDDLHSLQSRANTQTNPTNNSKTQSAWLFSLRRCASSDHDLATGADNNNRLRKPKIAFGSFILPKETSSRAKASHVQIRDLTSSGGSIPSGAYVHAHTRRSPYAAPTQVMLGDNRKQEVVSVRRPATGSTKTRQLQHQQQVRNSSNRNHSQRHSAPSTYDQGVKDLALSSHHDRISINTSPTISHFYKATVSTNETGVAPVDRQSRPGDYNSKQTNHRDPINTRDTGCSGQGRPKPGPNAKVMAGIKANIRAIAELNAIANADKDTSHHRFITHLESRVKEGT